VIGVRRIHVLPTPLSSFTAYAATLAQATELSLHPLLVELASRMRTRVSTRVTESVPRSRALPSLRPMRLHRHDRVAAEGGSRGSAGPAAGAGPPQRVLIHWGG